MQYWRDDADLEGWKFVQENGRTYYKKGEIKEKAWRVIDGKTYYFDHVSEKWLSAGNISRFRI